MHRRVSTLLIALLLAQFTLTTMPVATLAAAPSDTGQLRFTQISAGQLDSCGLTTIGSILCWGDDTYGQASVPPPPTDSSYIEVSAGYRHTCALTNQHNVVCWGADDQGQSSSPPAIQSLTTQVSAGNDFSCALTDVGAVSCWGLDNYHQLSPPPAPPGTTFTQVSAGGVFACALTTDDSALCWGDIPIPLTHPIMQFTTGAFNACGLTTSQAVFCWGTDNTHGQINVPPGYTFTSLSAGMFHMCGLSISSTIVCWGWNNGPDGQPAGQVSETPVNAGFAAIAGGGYHTCGLTIAGEVNCWGDNAEHQVSPAPGPPIITQPPLPQSLIIGASLTLSVTAISQYFVGDQVVSLPQSYQWFHDGQAVPGATNQTLTINGISLADNGLYTVVVTNEFGSTPSASVPVSVGYGIQLIVDPSRPLLPGQGVLIGLRLVDAVGTNLSSARIALTALDIAPLDRPWNGQQPNYPLPFLYESRLSSSGSGYLMLINTRRLTRGTYLLYFHVAGDPTLHTVQFQVT
jgi:hypothetical protein